MREETYDVIYRSELTHWWYRVRRELVRKLIASYAKERRRPLRILDIGCGMGALMKELQEFGEVSGVDVSPRAIAYCRERGLTDVTLGDAAKLPYHDDTFDIVVILDVLEHIPDDSAGCMELRRVLKTNGRAIVAAPAFMFLWSVTDVVSHHYRRYTRRELVDKVWSAGLRPIYASYFNTFLFPAIAIVRLLVRIFRIPLKSESGIEGRLGNSIFYGIFSLEARMIPQVSFPFGVSILVIAEKEELHVS